MGDWKPNAAEAQFLGELMGIDDGLATIARDQMAKGMSLDDLIANFKFAVSLARGDRKIA